MGKKEKELDFNELKDKCDTIGSIHAYAKIAFSIVDYYGLKETEAHGKVKFRNELYQYLYLSNFSITILELHKLISGNNGNDKFNLNLLFKRIEESQLIVPKIKEAAKKWECDFNDPMFQKVKSEIVKLRHTRYAHTAEEANILMGQIDMQFDITILITAIGTIVSELHQLVFNAPTDDLKYRNPVVALKVITDQLATATFKSQNIIAIDKINGTEIPIVSTGKYFLPNFIHVSNSDNKIGNLILEAKAITENGHTAKSFYPFEVERKDGYLQSFYIAGEFFELQNAKTLTIWIREINRVPYWEGFFEYSFL